MTPLELAALLGAPGFTVLGVWVKAFYDKKISEAKAEESQSIVELNEAQEEKLGADAAAVIANTAMSLIHPLQAQVTALAERVATLETENALTGRRLTIALTYIQELISWIRIHVPDPDFPKPPVELSIH